MFQKIVENHFVALLLLAIVLGVFLPQFSAIAPFTSYLMVGVIFFSALKVDFEEFFSHMKDIKKIFSFVFGLKLLFPLLVYFVFSFFWTEVAVGTMLLAALPSGMSNVLVTDIFKGNKSISLLFTILTHFLTPFLLPLIIFAATGANIQMNYFSLFFSLAFVVLTPLFLAFFLKHFYEKKVSRHETHYSFFGFCFLFLFVASVTSSNAEQFLNFFSLLSKVLLSFSIYFALMLIGFFVFGRKRPRPQKISFAISAYRVNAGLGLYLASTFFSAEVIALMVAAQIIFDPMMYFLKWFLKTV
jgi:bile acid:Na+ symporter, BASS family